MQATASIQAASPIPVPEIDSDEPVAVIPAASVAPLDGPPDGERINTFVLAAKNDGRVAGRSTAEALDDMRDRVRNKPLAYVAAAAAIGYVIARVLR